jgi:hypothetical protein
MWDSTTGEYYLFDTRHRLRMKAMVRFFNEHTKVVWFESWGEIRVEVPDVEIRVFHAIMRGADLRNPRVKEVLASYAEGYSDLKETYKRLLPYILGRELKRA